MAGFEPDLEDVDFDEIKKQQQDADNTKGLLQAFGGAGQALANVPSWGDIMLNRTPVVPDVAGTANAVAKTIADPVERQKALLDAYKQQREKQDEDTLRDPTSMQSTLLKQNAGSAVSALKKASKANPDQQKYYDSLLESLQGDDTSGQDIKSVMDKSPFLKEQFQAQIADQRANYQASIWDKRLQAEGARTGAMTASREDRIKDRVADKFDNDSQIKQLQVQSNAVDRGVHTLQGATTLTPQIFNEVQADFAQAIAGGHAVAQGQQERVEYHSMAIDLANLQQRLTNRPQDINSPEVKKYLVDLGARLKNSYTNNIATRAQQIGANRQYSTRGAQDILDAKMKQYSSGGDSGLGPQASQSSNQDAAALQWAMENPKKPQAVEILLHLNQQSKAR